MDWKYILSLSPEELTEDNFDELYSSLAWHDFDNEELSVTKCVAVMKLSQEIMKFKAGQVQMLLAELDELAIKQAKEGTKTESDTDGKSSRSRKSTVSLDYDDLEEKYVKLKSKYKQQTTLNDKHKRKLDELKQTIADLENEKDQLQYELQNAHQDGSQSDISETVREKHKELVDSLHYKNKQISNLLGDIEDVEKENLVLREKLTSVRDDLAEATKQINSLCEELVANKSQLEQDEEELQNISKERNLLKEEIQNFYIEKQGLEEKIKDLQEEMSAKLNNLEKTLQLKQEEIDKLKQLLPVSAKTTASESSADLEKSHISTLNNALKEQNERIFDLQMQLQSATVEMEKTTDTFKQLTAERESSIKKIAELSNLCEDLKKQLEATHERCRDMQEEVDFVERKYEEKDKKLKELIDSLKDDGMVELSEVLTQVEDLNSQIRIKDKQISQLVKVTNKLQISFDSVQMENEALRDKLGIPEHIPVSINGVVLKQKRQKKLTLKLQKQLTEAEEQIVSLKSEIQKSNRVISNLSDQVVEMGGKPKVSPRQMERKEDGKSGETSDELRAMYEENDALRKGLHEILDSINKKRESSTKQITSTALEKLIRALDVRHVTGWYHPAMRLQAELHALQGTNTELREQLRITRDEIQSQKDKGIQDPSADESVKITKDISEGEVITNVKEIYITDKDELVKAQAEIKAKDERLKILETEVNDLEERRKLSEAKLQEFILQHEFGDNEMAKAERAAELSQNVIILNRKCVHMENRESQLLNKINKLQNDLLEEETVSIKRISEMTIREEGLKNKFELFKNLHQKCTDPLLFLEMQKNLDTVTMKYRELMEKFTRISNENVNELTVLKQTVDTLKSEKNELENKLVNTLANVQSSDGLVDSALSKKLAQCEVNEIAERQRANHMTNLYELVKEQLQKSEERFVEFENYNKEMGRKNLILQENLKELQDKATDYIEVHTFKQLQEKCEELSKRNGVLVAENNKLKEDFKILELVSKTKKLWTTAQETEYLNLKHQIVDLQAMTDDKTVIAQLSSDVVRARLSEAEYERKMELQKEQLEDLRRRHGECLESSKEEREKRDENEQQLKKKQSDLQRMLKKQKIQYFGYIPLTIEEKYVEKLKQAALDKMEAFKMLREAQVFEKDALHLNEELKTKIAQAAEFSDILRHNESSRLLADWHQEKCSMQLCELRLRRQAKYSEDQLQQALKRISEQEEEITKLEAELLEFYQKTDITPSAINVPEKLKIEPEVVPMIKLFNSKETQTLEVLLESNEEEGRLSKLQIELLNTTSEVEVKEKINQQLSNRIKELEMDLNLFKKQMGDKQSQITFYEKHILELQNKKEQQDTPVTPVISSDETLSLKNSIAALQCALKEKEDDVLKLQSLLKQDRDEHSLAAARMQEEMRKLQEKILEHQRAYTELQESPPKFEPHPGKAAIEQYVQQVHQLENHAAELHTTVSSLNSQLQASREESVRWRALANDRLDSMDQLRKELEEQHQKEIFSYKNEAQKWREEVSNLNSLLVKLRTELEQAGPDYGRMLKERDDKIHSLTVNLRQAKGEVRRNIERPDVMSPKISELEATKEQLIKEHELLKKRFEQLLNREKNAKEEIRILKGQLLKKPALSARSEKSDKSTKDQLNKKISTLENEIYELKQALEHEVSINQSHQVKIAEDFDKWKKQKHWQQTSEKLKTKLKTKEDELEKLQQTCSGYKILISRLEREKHGWESKVKSLKSMNPLAVGNQVESLKEENAQLRALVEELGCKLGMQQHHSGGLGAAMLQEKLESQERKIAILEVSAKGPAEVRAEMERMQTTNANLQKANLRLEAENLELRLDLEKSVNEVPYLREQIHHLENYIEVLKVESNKKDVPLQNNAETSDSKKTAELEKTVFVLKRVVEKLQAENKRLQNGRPCALSDRSVSADKLREDLARLKQQYGDGVQKSARLEQELAAANNRIKSFLARTADQGADALSQELSRVRTELEQKTSLLDKVKVLLQRAATKERALMSEISSLKSQVGVASAQSN